jgi:hypothetical protein
MKNLLGGVLREINLIEAGVSTGESHDIISLDLGDGELLRASHADESLEAVEGNLGAACHKLQKLCAV